MISVAYKTDRDYPPIRLFWLFTAKGASPANDPENPWLRFYFHSHEPNEPPHVHVDKGDATAKFWLDRVRLVRSYGFTPKEVNELYRMVDQDRERFIGAWDDYFRTDR